MEYVRVNKITKSNKQTYDITINNNHNFFCNNFLIGNSSYRGNIKTILFNTTRLPVYFKKGDKISQMVFNRIPETSLEEGIVSIDTDRGEGGMGSTGN